MDDSYTKRMSSIEGIERLRGVTFNWTFGFKIGNETENIIRPLQSFPNHPHCSFGAEIFDKIIINHGKPYLHATSKG